MSIPISTAWRSVSAIPADTVAVGRMYYSATKYINIAERDMEIGTEHYLGVLKIIPSVNYGLSLKSNEYSISSAQLQIDNLEYEPGKRFSDLFGDFGFDNLQSDIRIWKEGITTFADCLPLFPNGISKRPSSGRQLLVQDVEDKTEINLRKIFTDVVSASDATTGYELPETSLGKTKPIIYGEHRWTINASLANGISSNDWVGDRDSNLIPILDLGGGKWMVAAHDVLMDLSNFGDTVWAWDGSLSHFVELSNWSESTANRIISKAAKVDWWDYRLPVSASSGTWANPDRLHDRSVATAATSSPGAGTETATVTFPTNTLDSADVTGINLWIKANWTVANGTLDVEGRFYLNSTTTEFQLQNPTILFADIDSMDLNATFVSGSPDASAYECYLRVQYVNPSNLPLFYGGRGKAYAAWIDSRPNHADFAAGSGTLIENPAGSAESVLRLGPGLVTADLDTASFDTASNALSALKASFAFVNPVTSKKFLADIGYQFRSYLWYQPDGTIKMQAIEDTYTAADRTIRYRDILNLDFPETQSDMLYTKVRVLYNWDQSRFHSQTAYSEAAASQTEYNVDGDQTKIDFEAPFIHDPTTAEAIRDFFLAQWKNTHNIAVVTVDAIHLDLDIGDVIRLDDVPYEANGIDISQNDTKAGQTVYPFWWIYDIKRSNTLTFKAIQLHDLTT